MTFDVPYLLWLGFSKAVPFAIIYILYIIYIHILYCEARLSGGHTTSSIQRDREQGQEEMGIYKMNFLYHER